MDRLNDDVRSGGVLLAVAIGYGVVALRIPSGDGEPGPGFLPLVLAVLLAALSVSIVVRGLKPTTVSPATGRPDDDLGPRRWLAALATVAYVALFQPLGFLVSTVAYCAALTWLFTRDRRMLVAVPVGVTAALFVLFRLALGVRLPPGPFG